MCVQESKVGYLDVNDFIISLENVCLIIDSIWIEAHFGFLYFSNKNNSYQQLDYHMSIQRYVLETDKMRIWVREEYRVWCIMVGCTTYFRKKKKHVYKQSLQILYN